MTVFFIQWKNNKVECRRREKAGQAAHPGFMVTFAVNAALYVAALGVAPVSAEAADNAAPSDIPVMGGGGSVC